MQALLTDATSGQLQRSASGHSEGLGPSQQPCQRWGRNATWLGRVHFAVAQAAGAVRSYARLSGALVKHKAKWVFGMPDGSAVMHTTFKESWASSHQEACQPVLSPHTALQGARLGQLNAPTDLSLHATFSCSQETTHLEPWQPAASPQTASPGRQGRAPGLQAAAWAAAPRSWQPPVGPSPSGPP